MKAAVIAATEGITEREKMHDNSIFKMNELERQFLELLQFNINVPSSVYANVLTRINGSIAISRLCDDKYKDLRKLAKKRSVSADNLMVVRWCPAIIS
ncbi:hypothetical protein INR49_021088 [Caranx melampygus]|nr:hypothetical protein INR49_021088 [Caranx melampygus]